MSYDFLLNEDISNYMQSLAYNVRYHLNVLSRIMSNDINNDSDENFDVLFNEYYDEYLKYYCEYRCAMDLLLTISLGEYHKYITGFRIDFSTDAIYFYTKSNLSNEVKEELIWHTISKIGIRKNMINFKTQ